MMTKLHRLYEQGATKKRLVDYVKRWTTRAAAGVSLIDAPLKRIFANSYQSDRRFLKMRKKIFCLLPLLAKSMGDTASINFDTNGDFCTQSNGAKSDMLKAIYAESERPSEEMGGVTDPQYWWNPANLPSASVPRIETVVDLLLAGDAQIPNTYNKELNNKEYFAYYLYLHLSSVAAGDKAQFAPALVTMAQTDSFESFVCLVALLLQESSLYPLLIRFFSELNNRPFEHDDWIEQFMRLNPLADRCRVREISLKMLAAFIDQLSLSDLRKNLFANSSGEPMILRKLTAALLNERVKEGMTNRCLPFPGGCTFPQRYMEIVKFYEMTISRIGIDGPSGAVHAVFVAGSNGVSHAALMIQFFLQGGNFSYFGEQERGVAQEKELIRRYNQVQRPLKTLLHYMNGSTPQQQRELDHAIREAGWDNYRFLLLEILMIHKSGISKTWLSAIYASLLCIAAVMLSKFIRAICQACGEQPSRIADLASKLKRRKDARRIVMLASGLEITQNALLINQGSRTETGPAETPCFFKDIPLDLQAKIAASTCRQVHGQEDSESKAYSYLCRSDYCKATTVEVQIVP